VGGQLLWMAFGAAIAGVFSSFTKSIRIGPKWAAREITDEVCRSGCSGVAKQIQKQIGGDIATITPKGGANVLGGFRGKNWGWDYHQVVVKEGRVFDLTTGYQGLPIPDYKALWQYPEAINFGF
jgi:hypothetical protein